MHRSVIIEGPDGCGKTRLASFLSEKLGLPIYTAGPPPKTLWGLIKNLNEQVRKIEAGYILDRCTPISQAVYRDKPKNLIYRAIIEYFARRADIVLCETNDPVHEVKHYDTDEHLEYIRLKSAVIRKNYRTVLGNYCYIPYNWRTTRESEILKRLS